MPGNWSRSEVEATVSDYFDMLTSELRGLSYNKAAHRRALQRLLASRSEQAIEFKHCNISAVLNELGFPSLEGYKPRSNYQRLLAEITADRLQSAGGLIQAAAEDVEAPSELPSVANILAALTDPPRSSRRASRIYEGALGVQHLPRPPINYLEREARNRQLGVAGELFVVRFEQARLIQAGCESLAERVEHVAATKGDGAGYDILSFESSGRERLIEVKTTRYGPETPFFVSSNEVSVSRAERDRYHVYRCFSFRATPRLFCIKGDLSATCVLSPSIYQASVG